MARVKYPFCYYAEFEDGKSRNFSGFSEEECICSIADFKSNVNDDDYVDGEYVGAENFIYE